MLHREDPDGLIVITQPMHAWIAAQLARHWGNAAFGAFAPWEEVCLGAEQHDNGWVAWEQKPTLNLATGRPHSFMEMPRGIHLGLWSGAGQHTLQQNRYAALLVSIHGASLYRQFHDFSRDSSDEAKAVRRFLRQNRDFADALVTSLRHDPIYAPAVSIEALARNSRLVAAWDRLSLTLCHGVHMPMTIPDVPTAESESSLTLAPRETDPLNMTVNPWPFRTDAVRLICEGRRLPPTFTDEAEMRAALAAAPWTTIVMHLQRER